MAISDEWQYLGSQYQHDLFSDQHLLGDGPYCSDASTAPFRLYWLLVVLKLALENSPNVAYFAAIILLCPSRGVSARVDLTRQELAKGRRWNISSHTASIVGNACYSCRYWSN